MSCNTTQQVRFQLRRGTDAYWNSPEQAQSRPLPGEPCFNTTTNQLKIGAIDPNSPERSLTWGELVYINVAGPVGTYTTLATSLTINPAVTLTTGTNIFNISSGDPAIAISLGQRVQFTAVSTPPPLNRFISYYSLTNSSSTRTIQVSSTLNGPNVVLLTNATTKNSTQITIGGSVDTSLFTTGLVNIGQALYFNTVGAGITDIDTNRLYYLLSVVSSYGNLVAGEAIITVSETFGGTPV